MNVLSRPSFGFVLPARLPLELRRGVGGFRQKCTAAKVCSTDSINFAAAVEFTKNKSFESLSLSECIRSWLF